MNMVKNYIVVSNKKLVLKEMYFLSTEEQMLKFGNKFDTLLKRMIMPLLSRPTEHSAQGFQFVNYTTSSSHRLQNPESGCYRVSVGSCEDQKAKK